MKLKKLFHYLCLDNIDTLEVMADGDRLITPLDMAIISPVQCHLTDNNDEEKRLLKIYGDFYVDRVYYKYTSTDGIILTIYIKIPDYIFQIAEAIDKRSAYSPVITHDIGGKKHDSEEINKK